MERFLSTSHMGHLAGISHDFIGFGWSALCGIFLYNAGELLGRGPLAAHYCLPIRWVWPAVCVRGAIDAAICACVPPYAFSRSPYPLLALVTMLGASTGWLATSVMQQVGSRGKPQDRETIGYMSILAIFSGFVVGSGLTYPLVLLVKALRPSYHGWRIDA